MAAEILLIAPDMDLYERAKKLRSTSPISFDVAYVFRESAVELAAQIDQQHPFKVIISRGATLQMLRESDVPAALVDIKMGDFELLHILSDAKKNIQPHCSRRFFIPISRTGKDAFRPSGL